MIEDLLGQNGSVQRPVRFGVIGAGYWGPNLVRNVHELEGAEVGWACDLRQEALHNIVRRYPSVRTTTSLEEVLEDDGVEAIVVATPVSTHYALAMAALEAGKHVLVEKPLAESSDKAESLIAVARASGLVLMPGHTFLYSPPVNLIKSLIASGDLGEIYFISTSRVNLGLHQGDVSVAWDLAPHDFSILRYWLDEMPSHVSALSRECILPGIPDVAFVNLEFRSTAIAHVELSWLAPSKLRPAVRLSEVRKTFGEVVAVERLSLRDVRAGEFFTMLGPSGSGKTTTLRVIAGFELADSARSSCTASTSRAARRMSARSTPSSRTTRCSRT